VPSAHAEPVTIAGEDGVRVSGLLETPPGARACYVLAHGAGAGMDHPFMAAVAVELAQRGIASLRYQFPAMERGARRRRARRFKGSAAWHSLDFRCIRPAGRRRTVPSISLPCKSRCCSCKERATLKLF
jgi:predicted alpha/beta-hydrolase family hydrolase